MVIAQEGVEQELTTFDSTLLKDAASLVGKDVAYATEERTSKKDPTQVYRNLTRISPLGALGQPSVPSPDAPAADAPAPAEGESVRGSLVPFEPRAPALTPVQELEQTFALAVRKYHLLQEFIRNQFVVGVHYVDGKMFGASKPVLLQPGAHAIAHAYGYSLEPEVIAGPMEAPVDVNAHFTMVVRCRVTTRDGRLVGVAFGSASSTIWSSRQGRYVGRAADPDKVHNSAMKMAVKRAVVAAVRQSTDAASLFAEDVEEGGYNEAPGASDQGSTVGRPPPKSFIRR